MSTQELLDQLIATATIELFQARGVSLQPDPVCSAHPEYAAVIGFSGSTLRGMTGLGMAHSTLQLLSAGGGHEVSPAQAEDWLRESSNQLLGRFKGKLLRHGVVVNLALPTIMHGERLELLASGPTGASSHAFTSPIGAVMVWLEVLLRPGFQLVETENPQLQGATEGDLMLF